MADKSSVKVNYINIYGSYIAYSRKFVLLNALYIKSLDLFQANTISTPHGEHFSPAATKCSKLTFTELSLPTRYPFILLGEERFH